MNHCLMTVLFVIAALSAAGPATAQQPGRPMERADARQPPPQHATQRPPAREAAFPAHEADRGTGRMSPEERRQLRRDINSHGRDIYREPKGRR